MDPREEGGQSIEREEGTTAEEDVERLAAAMPRSIVAQGLAKAIAGDWIERVALSRSRGEAPLPRYPLSAGAREALFEIRRAGHLVRGLEQIEDALDAEERGLSRASATRPVNAPLRISRLLITSGDGSDRFYRDINKLKSKHNTRLEVVGLDSTDLELGQTAFGGDHAAKALLVDHKDAVVHFLLTLGVEAGAVVEGEDGMTPAG